MSQKILVQKGCVSFAAILAWQKSNFSIPVTYSVLVSPWFLLCLVQVFYRWGQKREWAAFLFSSIYSFSSLFPLYSLPFPILYFEIIWMWMGYNPWFVDLFCCFPGMCLTLLEITRWVGCRRCSEQSCQVWAGPQKTPSLMGPRWTPELPLRPTPTSAPQLCIRSCCSVVSDS